MRLVVGPLPASVYWRRRAMVLGGVTLAVLMIVYSCGAAGKTPSGTTGSGATPSARAENSSAPSATPSRAPVAPAAVASSSPTAAAVLDPQLCTDTELLVTAVSAKGAVPRGSEMNFRLLIKNTSSRSCSRDVGPDQQELYIKLGTYVIFSSDHCDGPTGSEVRTFPPGHERSVEVYWNGKSSTTCSTAHKRTPDGPVPDAGEYQLLGRVGTDLSAPVTLKLS